MRTLLFAAALTLAASPALAYCPSLRGTTAADDISLQTELTLCRQAELAERQRAMQQKFDFDAALQAQQKTFELELRMQQLFNATQPQFPSF